MDEDELQVVLREKRSFAQQYPITQGFLDMALKMPHLLTPYAFMYGKFCISITYETYCSPPRWHAQASVLEDIGELEWGVPQQGMPHTDSWKPEDERDADKLLREALAPMDTRPSQTIHIHKGNMSLHYILDDPLAIGPTGDWTQSEPRVIH